MNTMIGGIVTMPAPVRLADLIRQSRESRGLSQPQFAKLIGMRNRSGVAQWENQESHPDDKRLAKLADVIGVPEDDLRNLKLYEKLVEQGIDADTFAKWAMRRLPKMRRAS